MTIAENIRTLAVEGLSVSEIARKLEIRYQHAYSVLRRDSLLVSTRPIRDAAVPKAVRPAKLTKPFLSVHNLTQSGFSLSSRWVMSSGGVLVLDVSLSKNAGVYAFAVDGKAMYVGVATAGLARRMRSYSRPGPRQLTSQRLNLAITKELLTLPCVEIYSAEPEDLEWNGLPVHGSAGLELGLIKKYLLPWNVRSAG